jgi:cell wall-associated NlpC family hydrolase
MTSRSLSRIGAVAVVLLPLVTGCTSAATLGVSPSDIFTAVLAGIPSETRTTTGGSATPSSSRARRIPNSPAATSAARQVLSTADKYVGTKYVWGGNTPSQGFDCSGFTKYVFAKQGWTLPRTSREQSRVGEGIPNDFGSLRPGDLMFFAEPGEAISHVAIYVGDGVIIHSSSSNGGVGYTDLNRGGEWFYQYFVAARRLR